MTKSIDDTGRARFLGHTKQGAAMTANILERLRFSNREIRLVESLVYHHLRPVQMAHEGISYPTGNLSLLSGYRRGRHRYSIPSFSRLSGQPRAPGIYGGMEKPLPINKLHTGRA